MSVVLREESVREFESDDVLGEIEIETVLIVTILEHREGEGERSACEINNDVRCVRDFLLFFRCVFIRRRICEGM